MMRAAIEEVIAIRKVYDELKEKKEKRGFRELKEVFFNNYKQFLESQEQETFLLHFIDF
jgi:hypothetical protein